MLGPFGGEKVKVDRADKRIDLGLDPAKEQFFIHVPAAYKAGDKWGLVVFVNSGNDMKGLPSGWGDVLAERKLLFVAPQNAGNDQLVSRRFGLAVMGALKMMAKFDIDKSRVYASGFSGGARMAGALGFYQPGIFKATIQNCGADFPGAVPRVKADPPKDPKDT